MSDVGRLMLEPSLTRALAAQDRDADRDADRGALVGAFEPADARTDQHSYVRAEFCAQQSTYASSDITADCGADSTAGRGALVCAYERAERRSDVLSYERAYGDAIESPDCVAQLGTVQRSVVFADGHAVRRADRGPYESADVGADQYSYLGAQLGA